MIDNYNPNKRKYVYYFLAILLSLTVLTIDVFSEKNLSRYLSEQLNALFPEPEVINNNFNFTSLRIFKTKSNLINENIRLKNEVIELRKLKIENEKLREENKSNNLVVKEVDTSTYNILESSIIFKTPSEEYLISGGENINLKVKDLVIDESSYVVGVVSNVRQNSSIISTLENANFSIQGIDKYGNEYLITSDSESLLINSVKLRSTNTDIKLIYTDVSFGHPGQFPIVDLSTIPITISNDKLRVQIPIDFSLSYFSNLYLVQTK